jgi:hypothetical protein
VDATDLDEPAVVEHSTRPRGSRDEYLCSKSARIGGSVVWTAGSTI